MAQLVERLVRNEEASGSNPLISTKTKRHAVGRVFCFGESNTRMLYHQRFVLGARTKQIF